ncbi:MAG TPA: hypothetical protein VGA38_13385 [Candidatus Limnocylindria bacterium]
MLRAVWETLFGLVVDDGSLAIGIVIALAIAWVAARSIGDATGWLLLVMLIGLVVANLYAAGRKARRHLAI